MDHKRPTLGSVRSYLVMAAVSVVCLRIIRGLSQSLLPYMVGAALLVTVIGVAVYRRTKF